MVILIGIILLIISFSAKWIMDTLQFHFDESFFKKLPNQDFWNPILSWDNKYVSGSRFRKWLFKEVLTWTTDAWHMFQFIHLNSYFLLISLLSVNTLNTLYKDYFSLIITYIWYLLQSIGIKNVNFAHHILDTSMIIISFLIIRSLYYLTKKIFYK